MRICFERLCFATKRPAVDEDQLPNLDDIKTINSYNLNNSFNSVSGSNATPITTSTSSAINQYPNYIKYNSNDNTVNNNNNNKNHNNYQNISFNSDSPESIINSNSQHQSKINNNNKQIVNHKNDIVKITNNESTKLDNQNKISEFLASRNSVNSNPQTTFAIIGDKVVNINNIEFSIAAATNSSLATISNRIETKKIDSDKFDKMHQPETSANSSCQLDGGATSDLTAAIIGQAADPSAVNNNLTIPPEILQSSLIYGTDILNDPNLDIDTINYIRKQQEQLQKLYQQQLQNQLQHIQQQAQTLFQPNLQISNPTLDGSESVNNNNNLLGTIAPPPSSLPLPLTFQQQLMSSSNQQISATQLNEFNNNVNNNNVNNNCPVIVNPVLTDQLQELCINSNADSSPMLILQPNNSYLPRTQQEQQFIQMLQVKDLKIQELQRVLQFKENEIAELKSHLDKFQSVFPFSRSSSGGSNSNSTTPTGPGIRKTGQAFQRQRAQGISAEPQSESSVMELLHVTFPKYDKEER